MQSSGEPISISNLRRHLPDTIRVTEQTLKRWLVMHHQRPVARLGPVDASPTTRPPTLTPPQVVTVTHLRQHLHSVLREVEVGGRDVVITHHGNRVATLTPVTPVTSASPATRAPQGEVMSVSTQPIIALVSLKGGVGKTTSTLHLAAVAAREGRPVTVLDGDSERSATHWANLALKLGPLPFEVIETDERTLITQARDIRDRGHTVVIDTPPNDRTLLMKAAGIADHVLVPVAPTGIDLDRLRGTLQLLADTGAIGGRELDVAILLVRFAARKSLAREAQDLLRDFPILDAKVRSLKAYEEAFGSAPLFLEEYEVVWKELVA
ncbi:type II toxin-antitoxin system prevent-host-death family antitoxin [Deinococcus pimensis]|uniref:type II toxin-antitoxin system prevent-host-death family antitoxin n=1 Tax=Deinococcus pimensis TaxID=309888 RepID=UPI00146FC3DD|nr:type II toxin-antitoxin system prevent-host-death family antitoxin [Deinococcus pimensis]